MIIKFTVEVEFILNEPVINFRAGMILYKN